MCDTHDGRAVCWRCSDAVAWWAEARGGPITCACQMPRRKPLRVTPVRDRLCVDCGQPVAVGPRCGLCGQRNRYEREWLARQAS